MRWMTGSTLSQWRRAFQRKWTDSLLSIPECRAPWIASHSCIDMFLPFKSESRAKSLLLFERNEQRRKTLDVFLLMIAVKTNPVDFWRYFTRQFVYFGVQMDLRWMNDVFLRFLVAMGTLLGNAAQYCFLLPQKCSNMRHLGAEGANPLWHQIDSFFSLKIFVVRSSNAFPTASSRNKSQNYPSLQGCKGLTQFPAFCRTMFAKCCLAIFWPVSRSSLDPTPWWHISSRLELHFCSCSNSCRN